MPANEVRHIKKMDENLSEKEVLENIYDIKKAYGSELVILGHHYQRKEIAALADFKGDSLELSRLASQQDKAKYIVFCGVHFMAESAAILCHEQQQVVLPDMKAGCPMADMADLDQVNEAWAFLTQTNDHLVPVAYMNSSAEIKAFCGAHGGAICTSSNAKAVMNGYLKQGKSILFIPDEHLGRNTSNLLEIPREKVLLWDPEEVNGGLEGAPTGRAKVILWKGYCHVHTKFTVDHVKTIRKNFPDAKIVVHPECKEELIGVVDAQGSTSFIGNYVKDAPKGATIVIGTELNYVSRLASENPDKKILELARSLCPNMYKINPFNLYATMLNLGELNLVKVPNDIKNNARLALQRMLDVSKI